MSIFYDVKLYIKICFGDFGFYFRGFLFQGIFSRLPNEYLKQNFIFPEQQCFFLY